MTFGLTYYFTTKNKELSYTIEPADVFLKNPTINKVEITVNGVPVKEVFSHRMKIWNSGNLPIKDVPFTFSFPIDKENDSEFKILNLSYSTIPRKEFGKVEEEKKSGAEMGMRIGLLNPGDEIIVSIITNQNIQPRFYSKSEGVAVVQGSNSKEKTYYFILCLTGITITACLVMLLAFIAVMHQIVVRVKTLKNDYDELAELALKTMGENEKHLNQIKVQVKELRKLSSQNNEQDE